MRTWAHGVSPPYPVLLGPGNYNKGMLRGLDFALDEARKRGLKVGLLARTWCAAAAQPIEPAGCLVTRL